MAILGINYDLRKPGRDYSGLITAIKSQGDWIHPMDSVWFIDTSRTTQQVRDALTKELDANDMLLVMRANKDWAGYRIPELKKWLDSRQYALA